MTRPIAAVVATALLTAPATSAQSPSIVSGRVVDNASGDPIANVRVTVPGEALGAPVVLTDTDGRFSLPAPAGPFRLTASKTSYGRVEMTLTDSSQLVTVRLTRGAAISGRVLDEFGEPVVNARVLAQLRSETGTTLTTAGVFNTNDRGEFRVGSLGEGTYIVSVMTIGALIRENLPNGLITARPSSQTTFFPNTTDRSLAQPIVLRSGDEQSRIDFTVPVNVSGSQPFSVMRAMPVPMSIAPPVPANGSRRPSGVVRGRVVSTDGRPLPYAQVVLIPRRGLEPSRTNADANSGFEFLEVDAGRATVIASKPGYSLADAEPYSASMSLLAAGAAIDLSDGETRNGVEIRLTRWSSLTGHVVDENGEAVEGASVQLMQVRYEGGRRRLSPAATTAQLTDDRGMYRLYGIPPGQYIVSASIGGVLSADLPGYVRSFFPNTAVPAQAQFVPIGRSQDVAGIDVVLVRARTFRIVGHILDAAGQPTTGGMITLIPSSRSSSVTNVPAGARLRPDGAFEFPNVAAGQYVIQIYRGRTNTGEGEFAALPVAVSDRDVTDLTIRMSAGSTIAGRFPFEASDPSKRPAASAIEFSPLPVDLDVSPANNFAIADIGSDWTFRMTGINGPRRLQVVRTPPGWALKEIRAAGIDVTDRPIAFGAANQSRSDIEVVLTDRLSELTGTVTDDDGRAIAGASVIVFTTSRDRWYPASRFLGITSATEGTYTIAGMPTGSYYAAAVARPPADGADAWQDPAYLASLIPRASSVTIAAGERRSLNLKISAR